MWCGRQAQVFVSQWHIPEKKENQIKKQANVVLPVSPKVGLGNNNCPMLNIYDIAHKSGGYIQLTDYDLK